jgi:hypothetical protein
MAFSSSTNQSTSSSTSTPSVAPINVDIAGLLKQLSGSAQAYAGDTYKWAQDQFAKGSTVTDQMVNDANTYASQPRIKMAMGQAETDTGQAMDAGAKQAEQQLQSYGIDPSSGRYAALETAQAAQKGAAEAGAGQLARQRTEDTGRQLRAQAINAELANVNTSTAGRTAAGGFMNTAAAALKYAPTAQTSQSQSQSTGASYSSTPNPTQQQRSGGGGGGSSGGGGGGSSSTADTAPWADPGNVPNYQSTDPSTIIHGNQPDAGSMDLTTPEAQSMMNSTDTGGGMPTDTSGMPSPSDFASTGYAQGGAVDDQTTGGQVPPSASPSQGIQTDDVPANLNEGEFVVPRDVAKWKGEEFFQKLIAQSRKARMTAPAAGKPGPALQGAPAFASQAMGA